MAKIYLAGPMSGIPYFNHPAFNSAAAKLRALGHEVCNPAEFEATAMPEGTHFAPPADGKVETAAAAYGHDYKACLKLDLDWIHEHAEAIVLLPGWEKSKGALAEFALARALKLKVGFATELGPLNGLDAHHHISDTFETVSNNIYNHRLEQVKYSHIKMSIYGFLLDGMETIDLTQPA